MTNSDVENMNKYWQEKRKKRVFLGLGGSEFISKGKNCDLLRRERSNWW